MISLPRRRPRPPLRLFPPFPPSALLLLALPLLLWVPLVAASSGDRLYEFRECVKVCIVANCSPDDPAPIPLIRRVLLWTCPAECDHACQTIVTARRVLAGLPVLQFHGKWPFTRVLGLQEPLSVVFSLGNLAAHVWGLAHVRRRLPATYPLRPFYERAGQLGIVTWLCSAAFHARDFHATEQADYLAAGASVLYGLYYAVVRVFRLDRAGPRSSSYAPARPPTPYSSSSSSPPPPSSVLRAWTVGCVLAYIGHVSYLKLWAWNYSYNMAANVVVGVIQNVLWSWLSWTAYRRVRRFWAAWPGVVVAWVTLAMSLELFDFPPLGGFLDAHSLWHLGTIGPAVLMYNFLAKDGLEDMARSDRLKS